MTRWAGRLGAGLAAIGALVNGAWLVRLLLDPLARLPFDFAINWTAARAALLGVSRYDNQQQLALGLTWIGPDVETLWADLYTSYIGPPTTVLPLVPFALLSWPLAAPLYRLTIVLGFMVAIWLVTHTLAPEQRRTGWAVGLGLLVSINAGYWSFALGQVDVLVTLALAAGLLALARGRSGWAGAALGVAALLKVSPALLLFYLLLQRRWRALGAALLTVAGLLALAVLVGPPRDLLRFVTQISPALADGSAHPQNQALPALLARLTDRSGALITYATGLGAWRWLAPLLALGGTLLLWLRRGPRTDWEQCGALILVALLAGPITWAHYLSWALVPAVLLAPQLRAASQRRFSLALLALLVGWVLLIIPVPQKDTGTLLGALRAGCSTAALVLLIGGYLGLERRPTVGTD